MLEFEGNILPSSLYGSGVNQVSEEGRCDQDFLFLPQGFESCPSNLPWVRLRDLMRVHVQCR